jgi:hypothetical protein
VFEAWRGNFNHDVNTMRYNPDGFIKMAVRVGLKFDSDYRAFITVWRNAK